MKTQERNLKGFLSSKFGKSVVTIGSAASLAVASAAPALAVGTADTAVTTAMQSITDNVVATIGAVGPIVITIFAAFIMWKYGKRIFTKIG